MLNSVIVAASGCTIKAADGRVYLDMTSGTAVPGVGHSRPEVISAVHQQIRRYAHVDGYDRFVAPVQVEFAERLTRVAGARLTKACLTSGGAEAIDYALELARAHTGRLKVMACREEEFVPFDDLDAAAAAVDEHTAAVIVEPIQGRVPADAFLPGLRELCTSRGALLICDENRGGMGVTGTWFSHQLWGVDPDIVTCAIGGGFPLGAVLARPEVFASLGTTMSGSPVACVAGIAAFDLIEKEGLVAKAAETGAYLRERLESVRGQFPDLLVDVRGRGLWWAFDLSVPAQPVVEAIRERGVLVGSVRQAVVLAPPLVITPAEIDVFIGVLRVVLRRVST
ncbi:aspartate aminotransferase family protein [Acrocarpospora sp. B8E8]|uniref:aspartate aminotransferase family protein n=1 Tax=Acrocarpospora sp. B8E8 TaxID=3153572 RepID=UPI00325D94BD